MSEKLKTGAEFDGETYSPSLDKPRLTSQLKRVFDATYAGGWFTLDEIAAATNDNSVASISARLRDLRKPKFGEYIVERRRRGTAGLWEYRVLPPAQVGQLDLL